MIIESIMSSLAIDVLLNRWRNRRRKTKPKVYDAMIANSPVFQTVGELKALLDHFPDDTPIKGSSFEYANMQLLDWFDPGVLCFGSQSRAPK